jgi:magnesium transporter
MVAAFLYDAEGSDRQVELTRAAVDGLDEHNLLWVDLDLDAADALDAVAEVLGLDATSLDRIRRDGVRPRLDNYGRYFQLTVYAEPLHDRGAPAKDDAGRRVHGAGAKKVDIVVGDRWIVTAHRGAVRFIESYRAQDKAETLLGAMSPQALAASLLDWHLEGYFDAVAEIEEAIDRLEEGVLTRPNGRMTLGRMTALKRQVSRLRALLATQRGVFYGLARPDFTLAAESSAAAHYGTLAGRYERAVDEVEHLHDLVIGSYELFTSRTTQRTNDLVKALTFLTVVIGLCAAVAGIFGMNFDPVNAFATGDRGFYAVVIAQLVALLAAAVYVRWQRWL